MKTLFNNCVSVAHLSSKTDLQLFCPNTDGGFSGFNTTNDHKIQIGKTHECDDNHKGCKPHSQIIYRLKNKTKNVFFCFSLLFLIQNLKFEYLTQPMLHHILSPSVLTLQSFTFGFHFSRVQKNISSVAMASL